jgi:hypothetical protein
LWDREYSHQVGLHLHPNSILEDETMNRRGCMIVSLFSLPALFMIPVASLAAFVSGSTGADGDFAPTANTLLQMPESGVFHFGTVSIPSGVTVTFKKNTQNMPVSILATGDVTISGAISVNGSNGNYLIPGTGGSGGFDGGVGGVTYQIGKRGEGPGGGSGGSPRSCCSNSGGGGGGGGYAGGGGTGGTYYADGQGGAGGSVYGNERVLPAMGGSGGAGGGGTNTYVGGAGGGGGGAIVIASSGTITVSGSITANGGSGANGEYTGNGGGDYYGGAGGGGSGGSIRLVATTIGGNGTITATGGGGGRGFGLWGGSGSVGRIRLEASNVLRTSSTNPPFSLSYPSAVVPPNMPNLSIASIGGITVPSIPKGSFGAPDIMLPFNATNPVTIVVTGSNIPVGTTVTVKAIPSVGNTASSSATLSGTDMSATSASISLNITTAYPSIITASVTYQLTAANGAPLYAQGEKVDKIKVATNLSGGSIVTYITESGKEIAALM